MVLTTLQLFVWKSRKLYLYQHHPSFLASIHVKTLELSSSMASHFFSSNESSSAYLTWWPLPITTKKKKKKSLDLKFNLMDHLIIILRLQVQEVSSEMTWVIWLLVLLKLLQQHILWRQNYRPSSNSRSNVSPIWCLFRRRCSQHHFYSSGKSDNAMDNYANMEEN